MLFHREDGATATELKHTTLATARLRFLFLATKIWRSAGRVGVSYSDQYAERGIFQRLLERLRSIAPSENGFRRYSLPLFDPEACMTFYAPASQTTQSVTRRDELVQRITTQLTGKEASRSSPDQLQVAASSPGLCLHNLGETNQVSWSNQINTQENWRISRRVQTTR